MQSAHGPVTGAQTSQISNAAVQLHREYLGKGPTRAKTYFQDNVILCLLEHGATQIEQTLARGGRDDQARRVREDVLEASGAEAALRDKVEEITGRAVSVLVSGHSPGADVTTLVFVLEEA